MSDLKYLMSYTIAIVTIVGILLGGGYTYMTVIYAFVFIPALEMLLKESNEEMSDEVKKNRSMDIFFDILLYLNIPLVFSIFFLSLNLLLYSSSSFEIVGIIASTSIMMATNGINVAHELGHRKSFFSRTCSKLLLMPSQYMHFYIEHNFGHHVNVGTAEDPATARYKQSLYSFWITSVIGQYIGAWKLQLKLLKISKYKFFSIKNDMMFYVIFQLMFIYLIYFNYGITVTIYSLIISVISFLFLETINYIEHYGLSRKKDKNGRYERVKTIHSWNSNHVVGRLVLYELTRHSDHHFISSKKYQVLESIDESPQLPYGYPTSILLSMVPPLWFKIMNPRVESYQN